MCIRDRYYLGTDGAMVTGWAYIENYWYYFNTLGAMQTGWQEIDGNWYYLMANGKMVAGKWVKLSYPGIYDDKQYFNYFNSSGVFMTDSDAEGCIHAVSYTHLDVYKRQTLSCFILDGQKSMVSAAGQKSF